MIYLLLAIICNASIAIIFKFSEVKGHNRITVTLFNYLIAFVVSLIMALTKINSLNMTGESFIRQFHNVVVLGTGKFTGSSNVIWGLILGIIMGVIYFGTFILYQKSVNKNGAGISGTFSRIGFLIPMLISIFIWHEMPEAFQWAGIILSIASIIIINYKSGEESDKSVMLLIMLMILSGCGDLSNKLFEKYAVTAYKDIFLTFVFATALIISSFFMKNSKRKIDKGEVLTGFLVGIPNLFSSFFLILALSKMNTAVAFPVFSAGSIIMINIASFILFKEKLNLKEKFCVFLTIISIVLVNL